MPFEVSGVMELDPSLPLIGSSIRGICCWRKGSDIEADCQSMPEVIFFCIPINEYVIKMKIRV